MAGKVFGKKAGDYELLSRKDKRDADLIGIVWDSSVTRRSAIVILMVAIVCFSLALLFLRHR